VRRRRADDDRDRADLDDHVERHLVLVLHHVLDHLHHLDGVHDLDLDDQHRHREHRGDDHDPRVRPREARQRGERQAAEAGLARGVLRAGLRGRPLALRLAAYFLSGTRNAR
jgi:hypothetical protein